MKQSPTRVLLIILFVFLGCFGVAYAAAGMLTALPQPAIGGTCGPSTASETAAEALVEPGSIGAGPVPPASNVTAVHQRKTFISQCQSLADRRGMASLAILVISLVVSGAGLFWVLRKPRDSEDDDGTTGSDAQDQPSYAPLGQHDHGALVGAGAVVGAPAAIASWPPAPQPGYGPPPGYPGQPAAPPYGAYPDPGYPQQGWPQQTPPYQTAPQQPYYAQPPAYPPPAYPAPQAPQAPIAPPPPQPPPATQAPIAPPEPEAPADPSLSHAPIPLPGPDADPGQVPGPRA